MKLRGSLCVLVWLLALSLAPPAAGQSLQVGTIEGELPGGEFDLVASALTVHHLDAGQKAGLFKRVSQRLRSGGRFVLGDLIVPDDPAKARTPQTPGFDKPSPLADQLRWLAQAGFRTDVPWQEGDLAVIAAELG